MKGSTYLYEEIFKEKGIPDSHWFVSGSRGWQICLDETRYTFRFSTRTVDDRYLP